VSAPRACLSGHVRAPFQWCPKESLLTEDVAVIRDDFTAFVGMDSRAATIDPWNVEPWPDPVKTQALLQEISAKISKYVVMRPEAVTATVLWTMTAWAQEGAAHSPILAAISVEPDSGKECEPIAITSVAMPCTCVL
jgi:hypothetical protein